MTEHAIYLQKVRPLTLEERETSRANAELAIRTSYGGTPTRQQFAKQEQSKYPPVVNNVIRALCMVVLLAAFTPSAIRLYHAGHLMTMESLQDTGSAVAIGVAGVLLAEFAQLVATLFLAMVDKQISQMILLSAAALATCFAIVGNIYVADPTRYGYTLTWQLAFAWLDAFAPPLMVLSTAYVLKEQIFESIRARREADMQYQEAVASWRRNMQRPANEHPAWMRFYVESLQNAIRKANARAIGREEWNVLPRPAWILLVQRELQDMDLHQEIMQQLANPVMHETVQVHVEPPLTLPSAPPAKRIAKVIPIAKSSGGGGGHRTGAIDLALQNATVATDGQVTVVCEVCGEQITKANALSAKRALAAHSKKHVNEQKQAEEQS